MNYLYNKSEQKSHAELLLDIVRQQLTTIFWMLLKYEEINRQHFSLGSTFRWSSLCSEDVKQLSVNPFVL